MSWQWPSGVLASAAETCTFMHSFNLIVIGLVGTFAPQGICRYKFTFLPLEGATALGPVHCLVLYTHKSMLHCC